MVINDDKLINFRHAFEHTALATVYLYFTRLRTRWMIVYAGFYPFC